MKKILIDAEIITGENSILIIKGNTGFVYTVQAGGLSCRHPECEGLAIGLGGFAKNLDTCSYGCAWMQKEPEKLRKLEDDFNILCRDYFKHMGYNLSFDHDRVDETMEGWIPVLINGNIAGIEYEFTNHKGYLFNGNCD